MGRTVHISALVFVALIVALSAVAQDIRLANGIIIKGSASDTSAKGLEVKTKTGTKTYEWETLSAGTRYRYDAKFRANYDLILKGLPPFALTNAPDTEGVIEAKDEPKKEKKKASQPKATKREPESLNIFDQVDYENVEPIYSSSFPDITLKAEDLTTYIGFQYGPKKDDVLYIAFDTKSEEDLSDILYPYTPGSSAYKTPRRISGFKKGSGVNRYINFKKFDLPAKYGSVNIEYDFDCSTSGTLTNVLDLTITVALKYGDEKSRFMLNGRSSDLLQGDGLINIKGILDLPILWVGLDTTKGRPRLVGNLNMSHMKFVPKDGMDSKVLLEIRDDSGKVVDRETVRINDDSFDREYSIEHDLKKLDEGKTYSVTASIDLGPFLGPADFEEEIIMPRRAK